MPRHSLLCAPPSDAALHGLGEGGLTENSLAQQKRGPRIREAVSPGHTANCRHCWGGLSSPLPPLLGSPSLLSWFARSFCFFLLVASSSPGGPLLGPVALAPPDILSRLVDSQSAPGSATASGSGLRRFLPGPVILATLCGQILQQGTDSLTRREPVITTKGWSLLPGYTQGSAT